MAGRGHPQGQGWVWSWASAQGASWGNLIICLWWLPIGLCRSNIDIGYLSNIVQKRKIGLYRTSSKILNKTIWGKAVHLVSSAPPLYEQMAVVHTCFSFQTPRYKINNKSMYHSLYQIDISTCWYQSDLKSENIVSGKLYLLNSSTERYSRNELPGGDPEEDPGHAGGTVSRLPWDRLGVAPEELGEMTEAREVRVYLQTASPATRLQFKQ